MCAFSLRPEINACVLWGLTNCTRNSLNLNGVCLLVLFIAHQSVRMKAFFSRHEGLFATSCNIFSQDIYSNERNKTNVRKNNKVVGIIWRKVVFFLVNIACNFYVLFDAYLAHLHRSPKWYAAKRERCAEETRNRYTRAEQWKIVQLFVVALHSWARNVLA